MGLEQNLLLTDFLKCLVSLKKKLLGINYTRQEEVREYLLDERQKKVIDTYLKSLHFHGFAIRLSDNWYYLSQKIYGRSVLVSFEPEGMAFGMMGDSIALGRVTSELERKTGPIKTANMFKAFPGMKNMGTPQ